MRNSWQILPSLALAIVLLSGCNKDRVVPVVETDQIFPLEQGRYRIYVAMDTNYQTSSGPQGRIFYKQEFIDGTETDLLGRDVFKLYINESPYKQDPTGNPIYIFSYSELWTLYKNNQWVEATEGNTRLLYLRFPIQANATWNGNLYNSNESNTYNYVNIDTTITIQGKTYEHCVYVEEVEARETGSIETNGYYKREHAYQVYAPGIGKILRHREMVVYQGVTLSADISFYLHEELIEHN